MRRFPLLYLLIFLGYGLTALGCSYLHESLHSARSSFPLKYVYRPSYETIGAMYKSDPAFAIELMERLSRKHPDNLAYRLTLSDMYKDAGRGNDAIRLWFEILDLSRKKGNLKVKNLKVYFIAIAPYQKEGIRPYNVKIDKSLVYHNIGLIYLHNAFYEEASEYFSRAADNAPDVNRKAELYEQAGMAIGSKKVEFTISEKDGKPYRKLAERMIPVDPMRYRKKEMAFYLMALSLDFSDAGLREKIEKRLTSVQRKIRNYEGRSPGEAGERNVFEPEGMLREKILGG